MDVRRVSLLLCLSFLAACANKTPTAIFPDSSQSANSLCASSRIENRFLVQWEDGHVSVESDANAEAFKANFITQNLDKIHRVEFDRKISLKNYSGSDVGTSSTTDNLWGQTIIEAPTVWAGSSRGQGVLVGVVDASVDYSHPQINSKLAGNLAEINGKPGVDDDGNGFVDDLYGWDFYGNQPQPQVIPGTGNDHGTHVSGIILADHNLGSMKGVAPDAKLIPANFMDTQGGGTLGTAIQGIKYVVSRGAKVINASWGGPGCSQTLRDTIAALYDKNVLFVVAAGNDGKDLDTSPDYPANYNLLNQINVAATRSTDVMTTWSNSSFTFVQLGAPGDTIYSTIPGGYAYMSGTSMAAPFVTGAAAVLWSARPQATVSQIKAAILAGVDVKDYRVSTKGRLNLRAALDQLQKALP